MINTKNENQILILPGDTIAELLEEKGMTQAELAQRMGRPFKTINEIIKGKAAITPETAIQLEDVFSVPANFWMNLEGNYRVSLARFNLLKTIEKEFKIAKKYPYKEMIKLGWIKPSKDKKEIIEYLLNFFGVTSLKNIIEKNIFSSAKYRISSKQNYSKESVITWLRKGALEAQKIDTNNFDEAKLKENISSIKKLMFKHPKDFIPSLISILADCGVALVVVKNLKNVPVNGVTRWVSPKKALIQMSIRYKYADIFWFSLFHEIGHLLLHRKKDIYINYKDDNIDKVQEKEADRFASNILISEPEYKKFVEQFKLSNELNKLKTFARKNDVIAGVVVGRLQNDGIISRNQLNSLRCKYDWVN